MRFVLIFVLIICINNLKCTAQKIFREGYIISNFSDTLTGLIQYEDGKFDNNQCVFKRFDIATPIVYEPSVIKGYGYSNGLYFESKPIANKLYFLKCLFKSNLSLYVFKDKLFLEVEKGPFVETSRKEVVIEYFGSKMEFAHSQELLAFLTGNNSLPIDFELNSEGIINVLTDYCNISNKPYTIYKDNKSLENSAFLVESKNNHYGVYAAISSNSFMAQAKYLNPYYTPFQTTYQFNKSIGFFYAHKLPIINHGLVFQTELIFAQRHNTFSLNVNRVYPVYINDTYTVTSNSGVLKLPLLMKSSLLKKIFPLYIGLGGIITIPIYRNISGELISVKHGITNHYQISQGSYSDGRNSVTSFACLGINSKITSNTYLFIESRIEFISQNEISSLHDNNCNFESFKFKLQNSPNLYYTYKSPLISFMVGIGF